MVGTETPRAAVDRPAFEPGGAGVGVWVATAFVAIVALAVSIAALVVSVSHETKKVVTTAAATTTTAPAGEPSIGLSEYKVDVGASTIKPGTVTYTIANGGRTEHELLVFRTDIAPASFPLDQKGDLNEEAAGMNKVSDGENVAPGATQSRTVDLSQPGTYVFMCNLPGHFKAGMYQAVTVK